MSLIPPQNFGYVEPDLYRSATPSQTNFSFLQTLHLKTVVYLSIDEPSQLFVEFLKEQSINFCSLVDKDGIGSTQKFSEKLALDALQIILNQNSYPILICCNRGVNRTGTVVGCLRKIQKWSLSAIFDEFRRFSGPKSSQLHEQFIELFDIDLVEIPVSIERLPFRLSSSDMPERQLPLANHAAIPKPPSVLTIKHK